MTLQSRGFWTEFIELYKNHPCLWKVKDRSYHNKSIKDQAYNKLIKKCQTANPRANKEFVQKRIRTLRTVFRKEHRKVLLSKLEDSADNVYTPQLWYYKLLLFTADQEDSPPSDEHSDEEGGKEDTQDQSLIADENIIKNENDDSLSNSEFVSNVGSLFIKTLFNNVESSSNNVGSSSNTLSSNVVSLSNTSSNNVFTSRNLSPKTKSVAKRKTNQEVCDARVEAACSTPKTMRSADRDEFAVYGEYVGNELRKIKDSHTVAVMQHLINDILFEGHMGSYKHTQT